MAKSDYRSHMAKARGCIATCTVFLILPVYLVPQLAHSRRSLTGLTALPSFHLCLSSEFVQSLKNDLIGLTTLVQPQALRRDPLCSHKLILHCLHQKMHILLPLPLAQTI